MKFIGKLIVQRKDRGKVAFVVTNLNLNSYGVSVSIGTQIWNNLRIEGGYVLGRMLDDINNLLKNKGEIIYNDLPKKIMNIANKEMVLMGLE